MECEIFHLYPDAEASQQVTEHIHHSARGYGHQQMREQECNADKRKQNDDFNFQV